MKSLFTVLIFALSLSAQAADESQRVQSCMIQMASSYLNYYGQNLNDLSSQQYDQLINGAKSQCLSVAATVTLVLDGRCRGRNIVAAPLCWTIYHPFDCNTTAGCFWEWN